jgi:hypothetical protein
MFSPDDFLLGEGDSGMIKNSFQKKIVFYSRGLEENLIQHSVNTKRSIKLISKVRIFDNPLANNLDVV